MATAMVRRDTSRPESVKLTEGPLVPPPEPPPTGTVDREAWIDFMLEGTFPASDPPTWTSLREAQERRKNH